VEPSVDAFFPTSRFVQGKVEKMVLVTKKAESMIFLIMDIAQLLFYLLRKDTLFCLNCTKSGMDIFS